MKHAALITIFVVLVAPIALGSDDTQTLLDAMRVDHDIVLTLDGKTLLFSSDHGARSGSIGTSRTFAGTDGLLLMFGNYNPLKLTVKAVEVRAAEPTSKGAADFIDAVTATLKLVPGLAGSTSAVTHANENLKTCLAAQTIYDKAQGAITDLANEKLDDETRQKWSDEAVGLTGVHTARGHVRDFITSLNGAIKTVKTAMSDLDTVKASRQKLIADERKASAELDKAKADEAAVKLKLETAKGKTRVPLVEQRKEAQKQVGSLSEQLTELRAKIACWPQVQDDLAVSDLLEKRQQLADNLTALLKGLIALDDAAKWSSPNTNDYLVLRTETQPDIQDTITVTMTPLTLGSDATLTANVDAALSRDIVLREYRRFVSEFGVAAVYSDLKYPKYKSASGVVAQDGFDSTNVNAAVTMNLICSCLGGHTLYPGFQIGVSKAKDYPGLMGGVVLRFASVKRLALATGRMITWYKDLDKLTIGSTASDNDIKADLKLRRAPTAWYLAAQYTF